MRSLIISLSVLLGFVFPAFASSGTLVPRFAYVANYSSDNVSVYMINQSSGTLTAGTAVAAGSRPMSITVDPSGRFAYVANFDSNNVSVYTISQSTGALTAGIAVAAVASPFSVTVDPGGRFAYVANSGSNSVSVYTIDQSSGALTAGTAVTTGSFPMSVTVDPSGRFAYVANGGSSNISVYTINQSSGVLTAGTAVAAGSGPVSITVDPSGRFAYVTNQGSNNISVYTINQSSGALTARTAVTAGTGPRSVTVDPTGKFAYVANYTSNNVSVYTIDQSTGALTAGTAVAAGSYPNSVTVDPSGRFAYVANQGSNNVSVYTIDQSSGALTAGTAVAAGTSPYSVITVALIDPVNATGSPTIGTATVGVAQATVSFTAPANNGGAAITGYTVTSAPGGITATGTASPITVTGLTNGTAYTFTVTASNGYNSSAPSAASNAITPKSNQTISFGAAPTLIMGGTGNVSAAASSTLAVTYYSTTPTICTVSGSTVSGFAAGTCTIAASQAGNANYNAAPQVTQTIGVASAANIYSFTTNITGSGSINNIQQNSPTFFCSSPSTNCSGAYAAGTHFNLYATPSQLFDFYGWSGAGCGTGPCQMSLNGDSIVTAIFISQQLLQLDGNTTHYMLFSTAYDDAANSSEIRSRVAVINGDVHLNRTISVKLNGGYADQFTTASGFTTIQGALFIERGSVAIKNIKIGMKAVPDFVFSQPAVVTAVQGGTATSAIRTTVIGGFSSAITLSASGVPTGTTATFTPASIAAPGSGIATLTLAAGDLTLPGTYPLTVVGTGGSTSHITSVLFTVTAIPNFAFSQPAAVTAVQGRSATSAIRTTVIGGFSSAITLSASGVPTGTTATFAPSSIVMPSSGNSNLTLTAGASTPVGTYNVTITGTGGGRTHTAIISFTVTDTTIHTGYVSPMTSGLFYQTKTQSGGVSLDGSFPYITGEQVSFSVGGLELASMRASRNVSLLPLESETASINLLRLLKSLDFDNNLDNGVQIPSTAIGNFFTVNLGNEGTTSGALYKLNPFKDMPQTSDAQAASILRQAQIARVSPAGTYTSFLVTGSVDPIGGTYFQPSECSTPTVKPLSGTITLSSAVQWESAAVVGSATLQMGDGSTATFNIAGSVGSISVNGALLRYVLGPVKNGSTRTITLLTQNANSDPCSQSLMYLRDKSQLNQAPIARVNGAMSINLPNGTGAPFIYTFTSELASGPDEFGKGSQDPDGRVVSQLWTSSKGSTSTGSEFTEQVGASENVTFTLTATDDEGAASTKTWTIGNIARTAEEAARFVSSAGGLYGSRNIDDTYRLYFKFDQANNRLYQFECDPAAQYCNRSIFNFDLAGADLRGLLENMRFLIPGTFSYGDTKVQFQICRNMPWGYTPTGVFLDLAVAPAFSLSAGAYLGQQTLLMSTPTSGAAIYYTSDGSLPTTASTRYTVPLVLSTSATVKAITIASGYKNSAVSLASYTITILSPATAPVFSLTSGSYVGAQTVQMSSPTASAVIRFTTDGSKPTPDSTKYTGPISLQTSTNFRAVAMASGFSDSAITAATYTITQPVPPQADCIARNVVWQYGSAQCLATYPGGKSGTSLSVVDSVGPVTGSGISTCTNGSLITSGNCIAPVVPPPPPPARSGLVVTQQEHLAYDNARCAYAGGKATQFGLQVKNETTETVDIRVCHLQGRYDSKCFVYADVKPGGVVPSLVYWQYTGRWGPIDYVCRSNGVYTIEWTTPGGKPGIWDFGRAQNGESQLIEKEILFSENVAPYVDDGSVPHIGGCIPGQAITFPVPPPATSTPVSIPSATPASQETIPDADGCYIPRRDPGCVIVEQTRWSADEFIIRYRNNCGKRVYGSYCNMKKDGTADCGSLEISAGGSDSSWTYNATGAYQYKYTGSTKASSDWVCGDKDKDPVYDATNLKQILGAH